LKIKDVLMKKIYELFCKIGEYPEVFAAGSAVTIISFIFTSLLLHSL